MDLRTSAGTRNDGGTKRGSNDESSSVRGNDERERRGEGKRQEERNGGGENGDVALDVASLMITTATDCPNDVDPCLPLWSDDARRRISPYCRDKYKAYFARSPIHPLATFSRLASFTRLMADFSRRIRRTITFNIATRKKGTEKRREGEREAWNCSPSSGKDGFSFYVIKNIIFTLLGIISREILNVWWQFAIRIKFALVSWPSS